MKKLKDVKGFEKLRNEILAKKDDKKPCIAVCKSTGCGAYGSEAVIASLREEIMKRDLENKVDVLVTGCHGFCEKGPIVLIRPRKIFYHSVKPNDAEEIITETIIKGNIIDRLLYTDPVSGEKITHEYEIPFYKNQERIIFGNNEEIDPTKIEDYIAIGGYNAIAKAVLSMTPGQIIDGIKSAGLRGRGGAGFPTGMKWEFCKNAPGDIKYIICNADEGDPGAFMDASLIEGNPHSIIEGMMIGAYAIGASKGYVYIRDEYPLALKHLTLAISQAGELGFLGKNILGSDFDFTLNIYRGAGAFVCGEETALLASLEGRVGEPRTRPPYPAQKGLWDKPTNINNVKTWANVPLIINRGAEWYSRIGTEKSKGTMIFSLVGKINNTGLVEVPMGISLRKMIFEIGGGIKDGKKFKAIQTGGPSGGCIPEQLLDLPVDYEQLTQSGAMMGSGGMIVMDENTCMVDVAKYFLGFLKNESCGKCTPCREGITQMHAILTDICEGKGKESDLELLDELSQVIKASSLCALGGTAPNPVLTTIRYFKDEYTAHIVDKRCPAGVCKELIQYTIDKDKCIGCGLCMKRCPHDAIVGNKKEPHQIDDNKCIKCGICFDSCKFKAVIIK